MPRSELSTGGQRGKSRHQGAPEEQVPKVGVALKRVKVRWRASIGWGRFAVLNAL